MLNIIAFGLFLGVISVFILLYIPDYGRQNNVLHILKEKYETINKMESPKILLIGGSNLAYGLNTEKLSNALEIPAYNMGVHAGLGLKFMLNSLEPYVKKGDVVVVTPEYSQFGTGWYGADELLTTLTDITPEKKAFLSYYQMGTLLGKLPKIVGRKVFHGVFKMITPSKYKNDKHINPAYHKNTFNKYGDATQHWAAKSVPLEGIKLEGEIDPDAIEGLKEFVQNIEKKGGQVYFSYPCFQQASFDKSGDYIHALDSTLQKTGIKMINSPERYRIPDEACFDTFYHLIQAGVDRRTTLLIEDLKKCLKK